VYKTKIWTLQSRVWKTNTNQNHCVGIQIPTKLITKVISSAFWWTGWPDDFVKKHPKCSPSHFVKNNLSLWKILKKCEKVVLKVWAHFVVLKVSRWTTMRKFTQSCRPAGDSKWKSIFWAGLSCSGQAGWPDWANFRPLGDCLPWAVFWKLQK
jgi:hypothetical protein